MDFSVIRPKPPAKKPVDGSPPKPPSAAPPPQPPPGKAPPQNLGPYIEDLDPVSRMHRMRSIEYTNARTWRMNFGDYPKDYYDHYGNYEFSHHPVGLHGVHNYDHHHRPPPRRQRALPPPYHHHSTLPGPPSRLGLPPPEYHRGPAPPPPTYYYPPPQATYYYQPPYHGGLFSDENPNGCMIM